MRHLIIICTFLMLIGCGQKGAIYVPESREEVAKQSNSNNEQLVLSQREQEK